MSKPVRVLLVWLLLLLAIFASSGCSSGGGESATPGGPDSGGNNTGGGNPPPEIHSFNWVEDSWTQEVPSWGSPVRLSLPVAVEDISFDASSAIGAFGIHAGGHVEGMDHVWLHTRSDVQVRSWADGTVTRIENMGPAGGGLTEYFVSIDYGQGLVGKHMEVATPLVEEGQVVRRGDPVAVGLPWGGHRSAEFMLYDGNRRNETGYGVPGAVSPFDYLNDSDKAALIARYLAEVVNPHFRSGNRLGDSKPWEPYLTNRHIIHQYHRGTVVGEWLLYNKGWKNPDPVYFDMLTILENSNAYGDFKVFAMLNEDLFGPSSGDEGTWSTPHGPGKIILSGSRTLYGLYRLDETGSRARLTIEWREGSYPDRIGAAAAVYIERAPVPRRVDAEQLGLLD